tara:strand:+ start:1808 stop:2113 length:306 start_codon:yes stop_codon:yes gene_type:complete
MSDEQKNNDWKERELGALWVKKSLSGTQYMTGHVELKDASGKVQLVVFKNKHKYNEDGSIANDKAPDFRLYMSEGREDGKPNTNTAAPAATANATSEEIEF